MHSSNDMNDFKIENDEAVTSAYLHERPSSMQLEQKDEAIEADAEGQIVSLMTAQHVLAPYSRRGGEANTAVSSDRHPGYQKILENDAGENSLSKVASGIPRGQHRTRHIQESLETVGQGIESAAPPSYSSADSAVTKERLLDLVGCADQPTVFSTSAPDSVPAGAPEERDHCESSEINRDSSYSAESFTDLPTIQLTPGKLHEALTAAESILAKTGLYYQRGGRVVRVRVDPLSKTHEIKELNGQGLVVELAGLSKWSRFDKRTGCWTVIDPCPRVCKFLAESWTYHQLQVINGTIHQPHLRSDATVCTKPGYDPETGMLGLFVVGDLNVPECPTRVDALSALEMLEEVLSECAFAGPEDRSAALSALLTAAVRPSLPLAPMFHVMAHQPGSGKSYLCQLITALATSTPGSPVAFPRSNDACDKLLLAQLMKAPAVIEFDNLTSDLRPFDKLCSALTSERLEGRQLGFSRAVVVGTKTLILSSGNNVRPIDDMVRRCISIVLDPGVEMPASRVYERPHLLEQVRKERIKYVAAALTIVRAWVLEGRPSTDCPSLASYAEWSNWCRQPLLWLGQPDPTTRVFTGLKEDPSQLLLGRILTGWHDKHGNAPRMIRDVVKDSVHLDETDDFRDALAEASGGNESINTRKLGHWLARNEGRIVGAYRLCKGPKTRNVENWQVVESDVSVVSVRHTTIIN